MKAMDEEEFQTYDKAAISHYNINDCLDLFRKLQFLGLTETGSQKNLIKSLEIRIITLVLPTKASITIDLKPGKGNRV